MKNIRLTTYGLLAVSCLLLVVSQFGCGREFNLKSPATQSQIVGAAAVGVGVYALYTVSQKPAPLGTTTTTPGGTTTTTSSGTGTVDTLPAPPPLITTTTMPPRFAYAADRNKNYIGMFSVDPATGILTTLGTRETGTKPYSLIASPDGKHVFVANFNDGSLTSFQVNQTTGTLETVGTVTLPGTARPISLAVDPAGSHLYALDDLSSSLHIYDIAAGGALTYLTAETTGQDPLAMAFTPDGQYAYVVNNGSNNISSYLVNADGSLTSIETVTAGVSPNALVVDPLERVMYVENYTPNNIFGYAIDYTTGKLGLLRKSPATTGSDPWSMAFDPLGRFIYVANFSANSIAVYKLDAVTGALAAQTPATYSSMSRPRFVTVDPSSKFIYVCDDNGIALFRIKNASGEADFVTSDSTVLNCNDIIIVR
jgi:6-phosphogluconolactonase